MPRRALLSVLLAGLTLAGLPALAAAPPATDPVRAAQVGAQAYDYGIPLLEFLRVRREMTSVRCPDRLGDAPVNSFSHVDRFPDATARTVVAPNTDTFYSIAHLDLSRGPLVLRHPDMGSRYYSFAMLDPYTNVLAIPGAREDGGRAAAVVIRWRGAPGQVARYPRGARVVTAPLPKVWIIGRTLVQDRADQQRGYRLMTRYSLTPLTGRARSYPASCVPGPQHKYPTPTDGPGFVTALNRALADNPPPRRDAPILASLRAYGIGAGTSPAQAGLDPVTLQALYRGIATEAATLRNQAKGEVLGDAVEHAGWYLPKGDIGNYGTDYRFRSEIALLGLGANTPDEAIYPTGVTDSTGTLLTGGERYRLTFARGQEPPARYFWSLTMYDADGYLVANSANRYSLGPAKPPLVRRPDGSVVIVLSPDRPTDPTVNWLPEPASGQFRLNLRLYGPSRAAITGAWRPPGVQHLGPAGLPTG